MLTQSHAGSQIPGAGVGAERKGRRPRFRRPGHGRGLPQVCLTIRPALARTALLVHLFLSSSSPGGSLDHKLFGMTGFALVFFFWSPRPGLGGSSSLWGAPVLLPSWHHHAHRLPGLSPGHSTLGQCPPLCLPKCSGTPHPPGAPSREASGASLSPAASSPSFSATSSHSQATHPMLVASHTAIDVGACLCPGEGFPRPGLPFLPGNEGGLCRTKLLGKRKRPGTSGEDGAGPSRSAGARCGPLPYAGDTRPLAATPHPS